MNLKSVLLLSVLLCAAYAMAETHHTFPGSAPTDKFRFAGKLESGAFAGWDITCNSQASTLCWGKPVSLRHSSDQELLEDVCTAIDLPLEFALLAHNVTPSREYVVFRQLRNDLPVLSSRLDIALTLAGDVSRLRYNEFSDWTTSGIHVLTQFTAGDFLARTLEPANWQVVTEETFACWFPDAELHELRPAYWVKVAGPRPHQRHFGIVDAGSGEVLLEWSGLAHDVIDLTIELPYWQPYDHSPETTGPCAFQDVDINGTAHVTTLAGTVTAEAGTQANVVNRLHGLYVAVSNDDTGEESLRANTWSSPFSPASWTWTTEDATRPELNLYYHTEFIHDWYKVLDPAYNALDYPMPAVANYGSSYDNAFWNGFGTYYGSGSNYGNFAMYSDVIYHEYTHGVTDGIYPNGMLPYVGQPGAMNEAWSDYFACTINEDPLMGEWLTGNAHSALRDLESDMHYPQNWVGEVHGDSPFISAPLWRLRAWLGTSYADSVGHFARYGLAETFLDYLVAVLETDDDDGDLTNGTPYSYEIYDAFGRSGIGPGVEPHFVIENIVMNDGEGGNGLLEAGESAFITFTLKNEVELFPPAATSVTLTASMEDPTLSISSSHFTLGTIGPRESVSVGPIEVTASPTAHDHWGVLTLSVSSEQLAVPVEKTIEFTVGIPKVQIAARDAASGVHSYVTKTLREMDKIFRVQTLNSGSEIELSLLPDSGLVIWLSGNRADAGLDAASMSALEAHVADGGYLVLTGKSILSGLEASSFARDFLGVDAQGISRLRMVSSMDNPFPEGDTYLVTGSGGAANQDSMTILEPVGDSFGALRYGPAGGNIAGVVGPIQNRTLTLGFGMEAVADNSPVGNRPRSEFLMHILEWAAQPLSAPETDVAVHAPETFALRAAYPNPFNSSVRLEFDLGSTAHGSLLIYDVLGREVHRDVISRNTVVYSWTPSVASGVYFAVLRSDTRTTGPKKLLLMR
ncbi:MAG: T9SS type A sorting domain-containing protein [Calditrichaeota bacterium]|nr:T9SS type A sorting domain-containing protein [Calditrichota bacterium]MCB9391746.1 T9SS type A sorting domain-containing protein [Calditrichota bacterium]